VPGCENVFWLPPLPLLLVVGGAGAVTIDEEASAGRDPLTALSDELNGGGGQLSPRERAADWRQTERSVVKRSRKTASISGRLAKTRTSAASLNGRLAWSSTRIELLPRATVGAAAA
jgi:hypothetical protein